MAKKELSAVPEKYPVNELMANCKEIFGVNPEVVQGALCGNNQTEFSVDELREIIHSFLNRRIIT